MCMNVKYPNTELQENVWTCGLCTYTAVNPKIGLTITSHWHCNKIVLVVLISKNTLPEIENS